MNRAYKVIWSSVKNCYIVTSELAKNKGKSGKSILCTLLAAVGIVGITAFSDSVLSKAYADVAEGTAPLAEDIAIGTGSNIERTDPQQYKSSSIVIGKDAHIDGSNSIAMGRYSEAVGTEVVSIGDMVNTYGSSNVAIGNQVKVGSADNTVVGSVAIGDQNIVASQNSIAIGSSNLVEKSSGVGIGYMSKVLGDNGIAIGITSYVGKLDTGYLMEGVAIGSHARVEDAARQSVALGPSSNVKDEFGVAVGSETKSAGGYSTAVGASANASKKLSTAVGHYAEALSENSVAMGAVSVADGEGSVAVGPWAETKGDYALAIGRSSFANSTKNMAIGYKASAVGNIDMAIGDEAFAEGGQSMALGHSAHAKTYAGVAIGALSKANTELGKVGYDVSSGKASDLNTPAWRSTLGAVSVGDINNGGLTRQITNVAAGTQDTDAVNVAQLKQVRKYFEDNIPTFDLDLEGKDGIKVDKVGDNKWIISSDIKASGDLDFKGDVGDTAKPQDKVDDGGQPTGDKEMTIVGGITDESKLTDNNIGVVAKDDKLVVKLGKNLKNLDSIQVNNEIKVGDKVNIGGDNITVGDVKITDDKITTGKVEISKDGINAGDEKITNVADGKVSADSKEAVNGSQLHAVDQKVDNISQSVDNLSGRVNRLDNRINKVGAGAAALAALHPLDFDPDEKLTFSAGMGNYRGENAAALGMFYRPDEKTMFSLGGTVGNGENMVNVGVSFALDRTSNVNDSKVAMARDIVELRTQVVQIPAMRAQIAQLTALLNNAGLVKGLGNGMESEMHKNFPDVPENHWAYEYVDRLAARGIIEGYPDGSFGGDRSMSRYEFAAILYRAMEKGVRLDNRIMEEFEAELGRVRVDRISGEDNDADKVERVRVNLGEDKDNYGSKIVLAEE